MRQCNFLDRRSAPVTAALCAGLILTGCGRSANQRSEDAKPTIAVVYSDDPVADVEIRLLSAPDGQVLARASTQADGRAHISPPSPEPDEYFVAMESLGDGGWVLRPSVVTPLMKQIRLRPFADQPVQQIVLPNGAIKALTP